MLQVLFVKLTSLGDLFHAMPALSDLRRAYGGEVAVDWLVDEQYAAIPPWHEAVRTTRTVGLRSWAKHRDRRTLGEFMEHLRLMREPRYDAVIDAQGLLKSALLGCLPARGLRHGYDAASARERAASFFYQRRHAVGRRMHAVERIRRLLGAALGYDCLDHALDYGVAHNFKDVARRRSVVLVPHAARPAKLWAEDKWIALGKLARAAGYEVEVCWGGRYEKEVAQRVAAACDGAVALELGLAPAQIGAFLAGAAGVAALDTGLAHIAAAADVPGLCLCVATRPELSGAYGPRQLALPHAAAVDAAEAWRRLEPMLAGATS